ncbi:MAG TPA: DUF6636 domain-containing protein [Caulobacteraceae bacterium]|nr:DUF6636 domain-containing protein [Caulobacteraceae bacterium]
MHRWTGLTVALTAASQASAQGFETIQTPSHNIFCMASPAASGQPSDVRCDLQAMTNRPPPPGDCPLSYGDSYYVDATGRGGLVCHGDTVRAPDATVLAYGQTWRIYGFTCLSQTTGLTCTNGQGHGFTVSREAQKAF